MVERVTEVRIPVGVLAEGASGEDQVLDTAHRSLRELGQEVRLGRMDQGKRLALGAQGYVVVDDPALVLKPDGQRVFPLADSPGRDLEDHGLGLARSRGMERDAGIAAGSLLQGHVGPVDGHHDLRPLAGRSAG
jgi:hypothetical protein